MWRKKSKIKVNTSQREVAPSDVDPKSQQREIDRKDDSVAVAPQQQQREADLTRNNIKNIDTWSPQQVVDFLRSIRRLGVMRNYINLATFREIDGETLLNLEERDLEDLGIKKMHQKKLLSVIEEIKSLNQTGQRKSNKFSLQNKIVGSVDMDSFDAKVQDSKRREKRALPKNRQHGKLRWTRGDLIGQGAFGRVFKGFNKETGQMMAVKEVSFSRDDSKFIHELANEVHVLRRLHHPNIVRYLGVEVDERHQILHIFCEWVPCGSVASMIKQMNSALPVPIVAKFTKQVLQGIEYLHKMEIVHRDIKGQNLLVDVKGNVKVADFGTAKELGSTKTASQENVTLRGTPYYMAPEVVMQTGHGRKADIWSLGATVMEMATAEPPWKLLHFENQFALLMHIARCNTAPPFPKHANCLPKELKNFLGLCFERDPSMRPNATKLLAHPFIVPQKSCPPSETGQTMSTLTLGNVMKTSSKGKVEQQAQAEQDKALQTIINSFDDNAEGPSGFTRGNSSENKMLDCAVTCTAKFLNLTTLGPSQRSPENGIETEDELFEHIIAKKTKVRNRDEKPFETVMAKADAAKSKADERDRSRLKEQRRLENEARQQEMQDYMAVHQAELSSIGILR